MLGFPGKLGFSGDMVWDHYQRGEIEAIRNYCETDVMNTWLVYLRFQYLRGQFDAQGLDEEHARVRRLLDASDVRRTGRPSEPPGLSLMRWLPGRWPIRADWLRGG